MGSSLGQGLLGHVETPEYFGTTWLNCSLQEHGLAEGQSKSAAAESLWLQLSLEQRSLSISGSGLGIHFSSLALKSSQPPTAYNLTTVPKNLQFPF